ncbi:uncharacterized protein LOC132273636 [Cornus florida]|uniref:uncharacterized protein LOC132273636 n=1 Tax=Cornus florida TaxID=4283 RepID=UPI00289D51F0|nr:uncharacterized protein LOC132273636 [Cornus florida]
MLNPATELASNHAHAFNPTRQKNDSYDSWDATSFGAKPRKTAKNYDNYRNSNGGGVQFRPDCMEDESGVCSPPLWTTSPSRSPLHPRHPHNSYRALSPNSRDQEIARGQWELMEMVKNMPESSYELSLRDLVQHSKMEAQEECLLEEKFFENGLVNQSVQIKRQEIKNSEWKAKMMRSGSIEHRGLFLKMVFPVSLGSMKKKNLGKKPCAKVSPNHKATEKSPKGVDKEWWKLKRFSFSSESEAGGGSSPGGSTGNSGSRSSSSNSSKGRRKRSVFLHGCCYFSHTKKSIFKVEKQTTTK